MLSEPNHTSQNEIAPPSPWRWSATILLLGANVCVWLFQLWARHNHTVLLDDYLALSVDGLRKGYIWQLLTYQFMHAVPAPWHLLLNSWAIFVFGSVVEVTIGKARMLKLYFLSGIIGGLFQMLGMWTLPGLFGNGPAIGASAGAFGLMAAFAALYPTERLFILLFFVIPLKMKARTFLITLVAITIFGILYPLFETFFPLLNKLDDLFGNIGHAAHLGGAVTGYFLARRLIIRLEQARAAQPAPAPPPIFESAAKTSLKVTPAPD